MPSKTAISQRLERQAVVHIECTIPAEMTIAEWRRLRASRPRRKWLPARSSGAQLDRAA